MILKLRQRLAQEESGFTLIELLVVMLILGILAAIAIPAFLNQAQKGEDSKAIANIRTAETAAETYATENRGDYSAMDATALVALEPAMNDVVAAPGWTLATTADTYTVSLDGSSGRTFTLTRNADGSKDRTCAPIGGACLDDGSGTTGTWGD